MGFYSPWGFVTTVLSLAHVSLHVDRTRWNHMQLPCGWSTCIVFWECFRIVHKATVTSRWIELVNSCSVEEHMDPLVELLWILEELSYCFHSDCTKLRSQQEWSGVPGLPHAHQHECPLAGVTAMLTGKSDVLWFWFPFPRWFIILSTGIRWGSSG